MNMQKNLKISILGKSYLIATDEDDKSIYQAAELVDTLMRSKLAKMPTGSASEDKVALIVALQLASDLMKKTEELQSYENRIEQLVLALTTDVTRETQETQPLV
jgi:cell division protein ZapA (FtsZ GTPase activity inhibitor)